MTTAHANQVIWDPAAGRIHTFLDAEGRCRWGGGTFDELQTKGSISAAADVLPLMEALELQQQSDRERHCTGPSPISKERWWEALECLPPENWTSFTGCESFRMSERMTGSIAIFYVRIGDSHWEICEDEDTTHRQLVEMVYALPTYCGIG